MTGDDPMDLPDDADDALAMDYALGTLDREARRNVERRLRSDPGFRALVEGWQRDLAPLDSETPSRVPPPAVWEAIAAEIAPARGLATAPARPAAATAPPRLWDNRALWDSLALWRVAGTVDAGELPTVAVIRAGTVAIVWVERPVEDLLFRWLVRSNYSHRSFSLPLALFLFVFVISLRFSLASQLSFSLFLFLFCLPLS